MGMIINKETSYLIGLAQTDGSLRSSSRNRGCFALELSVRDSDIIYKLQEIIPYKSYVKIRTRDTNFKDNYTSIALKVYEKEFRDFLVDNGVPYGKKSNVIKPLEDLSYEVDYVRGLIDGDGTVSFDKNGRPLLSLTTNSDEIRDYIVNYFANIIKEEPLGIKKNKRDNIYNICYCGIRAYEIIPTIYYDNCLSIDRKYNAALKIKEWKPDYKKVFCKDWSKEQDDIVLSNSVQDSILKLDRTESSIKNRLFRLTHGKIK